MRDPGHLNAGDVTFADCAEHRLSVLASCGPCRVLKSIQPRDVPARLSRVPIIDLMAADKLRCRTCRTPSDAITVKFEGNSIVSPRVILNTGKS